ncbi:hypothetical protein CC2G_013728 [Coprinopsis cinerea AmutBmut pab1-1]|nr:hypothetical protein CC2G_013728 [Coprinopsis cinerea AmutBmut pab1-1]
MSTPDNGQLTDRKILIFDVYGTLMDWESGIYDALQPLFSEFEVAKKWSRKEALQAFGAVETDLQTQFPEMPYSELLAKVHEVLEQRLKALSSQDTQAATLDAGHQVAGEAPSGSSATGASTSADAGTSASSSESNPHTAFGNSVKNWPIFPDTTDALKRLSKHFKLVVLSNVDRGSFQFTHAVLSTGSLPSTKEVLEPYLYPTNNPNKFWHPQATSPNSASPFTVLATAQDTGCYKPSLGGFQALLDYAKSHPDLLGGSLGEGEDIKEKVLIVAQSLPHDHVPANRLGIKSVWIDRQSAVTCNELPGAGGQAKKIWTWRFETLGEMADKVEEELRQS